MELVDVHAHLDFEELYKNIDKVISKCKKAGLKAIIAQGTTPESNRKVLELAEKYDIVKPALGFYPTHIIKTPDKDIEKELDFIRHTNCIAIGEVGLDYHTGRNNEYSQKLTDSAKKKMKKYFRKLVKISIEKDIPIIVHSRKAELEAIEILEEMNAKKVIMHCFSGKRKYFRRIKDNDWYISIPSNVERARHFHYFIGAMPLNRLFVETDSPYLAPDKGSINDPSNVTVVIDKIAELKKLSKKDVADNIYINYKRLFS